MAKATNDQTIVDLIELRSQISEKEVELQRARVVSRFAKTLSIAIPGVLVVSWIASVMFGTYVDLGPTWTVVGWLSALGAIVCVVLWLIGSSYNLLTPYRQELELERLYDEQALYFGAERIDLAVRQEVYRGAMMRNVSTLRSRGDRYRLVNNAFQSVVIVGSLATTTVASLSPAEGLLKWLAVGFSAAVGLSAGFTGYFKYRERAFYLRQTADDIEEQLNAYNLGLIPYEKGSATDRLSEVTARVEAIRVAQQRREQQLDQPKASVESNS